MVCAAVILMNIMMVYFFGWTEGLAQGRYLFPSLLPLGIIVATGLKLFSCKIRVPVLYPALMLFYILFSILALFFLIVTSYYS
jgi:hypothetical protein